MLALEMVHEIDRLLQAGELSQRTIAERLGVSRGTVAAIAKGERALFGRTDVSDDSHHSRQLPPQRCPKCGFLIHPPCLVCRTRTYRQGRRAIAILEARQPLSGRRSGIARRRLRRRNRRVRAA